MAMYKDEIGFEVSIDFEDMTASPTSYFFISNFIAFPFQRMLTAITFYCLKKLRNVWRNITTCIDHYNEWFSPMPERCKEKSGGENLSNSIGQRTYCTSGFQKTGSIVIYKPKSTILEESCL